MSLDENKINSIGYKVINLSDGGLTIKGALNMNIDDFIKEYCTEEINYHDMIQEINSSTGYNLKDLIKACKIGKSVFRKINKYSLKILEYIHEAMVLRVQGKNEEAQNRLRKIEKIRHFTLHPLLEIMSGYHTILEIYLQRQEIQDIDQIEDYWKKRDAQLDRGLNYYGELCDAINKFLVNLESLIKELNKLREK